MTCTSITCSGHKMHRTFWVSSEQQEQQGGQDTHEMAQGRPAVAQGLGAIFSANQLNGALCVLSSRDLYLELGHKDCNIKI